MVLHWQPPVLYTFDSDPSLLLSGQVTIVQNLLEDFPRSATQKCYRSELLK